MLEASCYADGFPHTPSIPHPPPPLIEGLRLPASTLPLPLPFVDDFPLTPSTLPPSPRSLGQALAIWGKRGKQELLSVLSQDRKSVV